MAGHRRASIFISVFFIGLCALGQSTPPATDAPEKKLEKKADQKGDEKINKRILEDRETDVTREHHQKSLDLQGISPPIPKTKGIAKRKIQPNTGECDPAQASTGSAMGDAAVEDLHCVSPAPLGPDLKNSGSVPPKK